MKTQKSLGYALVSTIWILAALVLFTGFMASRIGTIQESVLSSSNEQRGRLEKRSTLSTILYLGSTYGVSFAGISVSEPEEGRRNDLLEITRFPVTGKELRLDSRTYDGVGEVQFSLQDTSSLISLGSLNNTKRLEKLLGYYGIPKVERQRLIASLKDYVDRDELASLNGAERSSYLRRNMLPPTNRFLHSPTQIYNVFGWSAALGSNKKLFVREVTPLGGNNYNFNTLTETGMLITDNINEVAVREIKKYRKDGFFKSIADVNKLIDVLVPVDPLEFGLLPSSSIRVTMWHGLTKRENLIGLTFTPMSGYAPWEIEYNVNLGMKSARLLGKEKNIYEPPRKNQPSIFK